MNHYLLLATAALSSYPPAPHQAPSLLLVQWISNSLPWPTTLSEKRMFYHKPVCIHKSANGTKNSQNSIYPYHLQCILMFFIRLFFFFNFMCETARGNMHTHRGRSRGRRGRRGKEAQPESTLSTRHMARSQDPESLIWDETKNWTLNRLSDPGSPSLFQFIVVK